MKNFAKQWDDVGGTDGANGAIATEKWAEPHYFNLSGIRTAHLALEELFKIYGHDLHKQVFLELGCGAGRETKYFADVFDKIMGVDVSLNMIMKAKIRCDKISPFLIVGDGKTIPVADHSIDILYSFIVLQHCPQDVVRSYFKEAKRVLKPGGTFMFQIHIGDSHHEPDNYTDFSMWTMEEIREELKDMKEIKLIKSYTELAFNIYENTNNK